MSGQVDRAESVSYDRIAGSYDATRGGMERGRRIAGVVAGMLPTDPVLEVGVGTGLVAAGLAELGRPPVGVDLSLPMLAGARERIPGRLAVGDALRLPVGTGTVAGVCLIHVLHLVGDIPAALAEVARVLRPGGGMVATAFPGEAPPGDVHEEMVRFQDRTGGRPPVVDVAVVTRLAAEAGFVPAGRHDEPGHEVTPRYAADLVEARSNSWMWTVDDATWAREMPPALARLRALPDQDRVRPGPGPAVLAFRHP
ncbi:MAG TPA: class I SAM-dependent methyltransferase [Mycobacteriales bacterium]|nr:class I SAM-dependent methyltransferase [Mycobacteriales bacterium]